MNEFLDPARSADAAVNDGPAHSPTMEEIDREVAQAMAEMAPGDMAELTGEVVGTDSLAAGTELIGTVAGVSENDVFLQFGVKSQGVMPRNQFGKKEHVEVGRRVDVVVDRFDAESGLWIVSRKGAAQRATWTTLTVGMLVEGRVTGLIKGGLEVDLKGVRAFMPGSQVDIVPMKDISLLLNQPVKCEVIELDRRSKSVIVSRRKTLEKELAESREKLKAELAEGQVRPGVVRSITDFGAFVDLGGVDGLVHIRDISWGQVAKVGDVLKPGQHVEVMVLKIDTKRDRISLGLKQIQPDPWNEAPAKYPVGTRLKVRVVRLADFGAFAELEPGVDGLIPISEMGWSRTKKTTDAVSVGSVVDCLVIRVEPDKKRIALSMKQVQADPWAEVFASYPVNSLVKGKVSRLADFGAFVELAPGVEALVHISELSDKRVKTAGDVVQPGQEVEARVLGVDTENRRISLSIKSAHAPTAAELQEAVASHQAAPKIEKKRKKPLRGGLASHFEW